MISFARIALIAVGLVGTGQATADGAGPVPTVIDGDTLRINGTRLRLRAIDAPETHRPGCAAEAALGALATGRLRQLVGEARAIEIRESGDRDRHGRPLVDLLLDGVDAGDVLITEGLAVAYRPGRAAWKDRRRHWCGDERRGGRRDRGIR